MAGRAAKEQAMLAGTSLSARETAAIVGTDRRQRRSWGCTRRRRRPQPLRSSSRTRAPPPEERCVCSGARPTSRRGEDPISSRSTPAAAAISRAVNSCADAVSALVFAPGWRRNCAPALEVPTEAGPAACSAEGASQQPRLWWRWMAVPVASVLRVRQLLRLRLAGAPCQSSGGPTDERTAPMSDVRRAEVQD